MLASEQSRGLEGHAYYHAYLLQKEPILFRWYSQLTKVRARSAQGLAGSAPKTAQQSLPHILVPQTADLQAYRQTPYTLLIPLDLNQECRTTEAFYSHAQDKQ